MILEVVPNELKELLSVKCGELLDAAEVSLFFLDRVVTGDETYGGNPQYADLIAALSPPLRRVTELITAAQLKFAQLPPPCRGAMATVYRKFRQPSSPVTQLIDCSGRLARQGAVNRAMWLSPAAAALALSLCLWPEPGAVAEQDLTVVQTSEGALRGHMMTSFGGRLFIAFRGVPYARPPVGVLRFRPPEPPVPWTGIRSAKYEGSVCPQLLVTTDMFAGDEDCLYLNVYTHKDANKVPVLVWLHGGGFHAGDGGVEENGPEYLMDQNLVLVTLNHRLGVLGFLSTGDAELPGNYGLKDQVMALQWVQRNVAEFGGDPSRVTLYGAGSGGACAQYHMLSPLSAGLFHRVIAQSGSVLNPWALQRKPIRNAQKLAQLVGCSSWETSLQIRHCLSAAPAEQLVRTLYHFPHWAVRFPIPWAPVVEAPGDRKAFLLGEPENLLRDGFVNYVPLIAGSSLEEHAALATLVESRQDLKNELLNDFDGVIRRALHLHHLRADLLRRLRDFYLGSGASGSLNRQGLADLFSDGIGYNRRRTRQGERTVAAVVLRATWVRNVPGNALEKAHCSDVRARTHRLQESLASDEPKAAFTPGSSRGR
ncbi:venom carboxylesterase-6-like [Schistocerca serialis cubense]|uniref:venom carboxylesterase-6-like n=1 Tax=Schistocerca serialis cubense TaxID=2023355 RepID=UPI00214EAACE|nr:venom carboxylesterase-6-like [Schistocerca serialis cubense]